MEPTNAPVMPEWLIQIMRVIDRLPLGNDDWKRIRIALTEAELAEYREFIKASSHGQFYHAIRGCPIHVEPSPKDLSYIVEDL